MDLVFHISEDGSEIRFYYYQYRTYGEHKIFKTKDAFKMALSSVSMRFSKGTPRTKITGNQNKQIAVYYAQREYFIAALIMSLRL